MMGHPNAVKLMAIHYADMADNSSQSESIKKISKRVLTWAAWGLFIAMSVIESLMWAITHVG